MCLRKLPNAGEKPFEEAEATILEAHTNPETGCFPTNQSGNPCNIWGI